MQFKEIVGQDAIKQRLMNTVNENRVSHAQLFLGPEGSGSLALAVAYAQYLCCEDKQPDDSCGVCSSCRKYQKLMHPDLHFSYPTFGLPKEHSERGFYIVKGSVELSGNTYHAGQMLVFTTGADPLILAKEKTTLMLLGGEPLGERFIWWNFVSSSRERIETAKRQWAEGGFARVPGESEFIPLPPDLPPPEAPPGS